MSSKVTRLIQSAKNPSTLLYASIIGTAHLVPTWLLAIELLCVCTAHLLAVPCVSSSISTIANAAVIRMLAGTPGMLESRVLELTKLVLRHH